MAFLSESTTSPQQLNINPCTLFVKSIFAYAFKSHAVTDNYGF